MSQRAVPRLRRFLGARLRAVRKERRLSQEVLGRRAGLSGKFIGEVERGEKSISVDNLYRVSVVLGVALHHMVDFPKHQANLDMEQIFAFLLTQRADVARRASTVLRTILG
jgi:transcriptional regulator with XRE-family HTH domain